MTPVMNIIYLASDASKLIVGISLAIPSARFALLLYIQHENTILYIVSFMHTVFWLDLIYANVSYYYYMHGLPLLNMPTRNIHTTAQHSTAQHTG